MSSVSQIERENGKKEYLKRSWVKFFSKISVRYQTIDLRNSENMKQDKYTRTRTQSIHILSKL